MGLFTSLARKAAAQALRRGARAARGAIDSAKESLLGAAGPNEPPPQARPDPFAKVKAAAAEAARKKLEE